ncbi:MAG: hypothetical protein H6Q13_1808 [Bacteroidetes bacterium]|jgi:hypothetical protein|nr:hypothetical protein [Bacteroidota bacterium]
MKLKLLLLKLGHTIIWVFFVFMILFTLYSGITNRIDRYTWAAILAVIMEGIVIWLFRGRCPLTIIARKYSNSTKDNFDIFLPNWLAKYNKQIFTSLFLTGLLLVLIRYICSA